MANTEFILTFLRHYATLLASVALATTALASEFDDASGAVEMSSLSGSPDRLSGGDALLRISLSRPQPFSVRLNGTDVTGAFSPDASATVFTGTIRGLRNGKNELVVRTLRRSRKWQLTNFPLQGPIISGRHIQPFLCQTASFKLPDGSTLGPAHDASCRAETRISYIYMPVGGKAFKPLPDLQRLPDDVSRTTTTTGSIVPFVVRVETKTINRGIYQSAILHDPIADAPPTPFAPPMGWNRVLIAVHGAGCPGGWYTQAGTGESWVLDADRLAQGYAILANTLQNPSTSCNAFLAGETAMMGKEHFIETYGVPHYSLTIGSSGGAYTSLQIIDAFPGLFDGALLDFTFPDALSIALSSMDAQLLRHYFTSINPTGASEAQQVAVSGYQGTRAWFDAANQAGRTDPVADRQDAAGYVSAIWNPIVPKALRYDPVSNPRGARPTIWDVSRNVYGTDRTSGRALRVFDNVGVQYGLAALNAGVIGRTQFLDLNERVGGFDRDNNYVPDRTIGDRQAIVEAYRSGLQLSGAGGLANVPILDLSGSMNEVSNYHYQWFHFAVRERLRAANGHTGNHIMWRGELTSGETPNNTTHKQAFRLINQWIEAIRLDQSRRSAYEKLLRNKPSELTDGCWGSVPPHDFVAEEQTFTAEPRTQCSALWPAYAFPRFVAGEPLAAATLKCRLKPVDPRDYVSTFTEQELNRLRRIFPKGVCDWSQPGLDFRHVQVGISYGPAPSVTTNAVVNLAGN